MSEDTVIEGGCLCGHVRYRITGAVGSSAYCHCKMCRKAGGGPVSAWISVARDRLAFVGGTPSVYESSPGAERRFCPQCGAQLTFNSDRYPDDIDVTVGTLDDPDSHPPSHHVWTKSGISWLCLDEHIPSYDESMPTGVDD
jgi:hypothetical protein